MNDPTIIVALKSLGFENGWVVNEHGIVHWDGPQPQPTEAELIAAGWIKPEVAQEAPQE